MTTQEKIDKINKHIQNMSERLEKSYGYLLKSQDDISTHHSLILDTLKKLESTLVNVSQQSERPQDSDETKKLSASFAEEREELQKRIHDLTVAREAWKTKHDQVVQTLSSHERAFDANARAYAQNISHLNSEHVKERMNYEVTIERMLREAERDASKIESLVNREIELNSMINALTRERDGYKDFADKNKAEAEKYKAELEARKITLPAINGTQELCNGIRDIITELRRK